MPMTEIEPGFSVAPQISADDISTAAKDGITAIVCNRPDGEDPGQPTMDEMEKAAHDAGLVFERLPITGGQLPSDYIDRMRSILDHHDKVLAYCRSGTRCTVLWAAARSAAGNDPATLLEKAGNAGYDLGAVKPLLDNLSAGS